MMEEVAVPVACDRQTPSSSPVSEDEVLACLVVETGPKPKGQVKRAKLKEGVVQSQGEKEDPIDKYQRENKLLLRASLRLEQENDSLAHRLVTSKIALRTSLDEAEDTVDDLMEQLRQARHRLRITEEEMRGREQEAQQMKEGFRKEMDSAEQGVKKSARIVADYKQICSQLTLRLEVQQATNKEEMEALKGVLRACPGCRLLLEPRDDGGGDDDDDDKDDVATATGPGPEGAERRYALDSRRAERQRAEQRSRREKEALELQVRALERELAQSKLQLVEANCSVQELEHQNNLLSSDLQAARNSWFTKAFAQRRASSGGGLGLSRDDAPLAGWRAKRLAWLPKESPGDL